MFRILQGIMYINLHAMLSLLFYCSAHCIKRVVLHSKFHCFLHCAVHTDLLLFSHCSIGSSLYATLPAVLQVIIVVSQEKATRIPASKRHLAIVFIGQIFLKPDKGNDLNFIPFNIGLICNIFCPTRHASLRHGASRQDTTPRT